MEQIKVIACDLDGTLLHHDQTIHQKNKETLLKAQALGYRVILATGRRYEDVIPYMEELKLVEHESYVICNNGLEIFDLKQNTCTSFIPFQVDEAKRLIKIAKAVKVSVYLHMHDMPYGMNNHPLLKHMRFMTKFKRFMSSITWDKELEKRIDEPLCKMAFIATPRSLKRFKHFILDRYPETYQFFDMNAIISELSHIEVSKKAAVETLIHKLGYDFSQVMALGDSGNDEALLMAAGVGVVMKNGLKKLQKKGLYITNKTNNEDGVSDFIETHLLQKKA